MEQFQMDLAGRTLTIETGELAKQAGGAVMVGYGDTRVLVTATGSKEAKDIDFFPLTVDYEEKMYAVGKIPGGFNKRECMLLGVYQGGSLNVKHAHLSLRF